MTYGLVVSEENVFKGSTNQKIVTMLFVGSRLNGSFFRGPHKIFFSTSLCLNKSDFNVEIFNKNNDFVLPVGGQ